MRFIILHKTNARWEAGEIPEPDLIADVGKLIGDLRESGVFRAGEGLRASSQGARVTLRGGVPRVTRGPLLGTNELPAGFDIIRAATLDEAIRWACELGEALGGDLETEVRPVTEPWDIGLVPEPEEVTSRRFIVLRKGSTETELDAPPAAQRREATARVRARRAGDLLATETVRPSSRGRRYKNTTSGITLMDGPFTESKELIAGFVIIEVASLDEASRWAARYITSVRAEETDLLELDAQASR
jgi:hypothetical protein